MKTLFLLISFLCAQSFYAQNLISITGEGSVKVMPDRAVVKVRVENQGSEAKKVQEMNNQSINSVMKSLKSIKFDMKDVKTEWINLNKNYNYETKEFYYVANQTIVIVLKDLTLYEDVMNRLMDSGVNRIEGVSFESSQIEKLESEARKLAMQNAKQKAQDYVGVLGQKLGKAKTIAENQGYTPRPMYEMAMMKSASQDASQETIAVGEIEVKSSVSVSFELD